MELTIKGYNGRHSILRADERSGLRACAVVCSLHSHTKCRCLSPLQHQVTAATYTQRPTLPPIYFQESTPLLWPITNVLRSGGFASRPPPTTSPTTERCSLWVDLPHPLHISANLLRSSSPDLRPSILTSGLLWSPVRRGLLGSLLMVVMQIITARC